jgi:alanine or glycine:cation symporter, AGCS family
MQQVNDFLNQIDSYLGSSPWFVYFLIGTGIFFTIYLRFPQIRYFGHAIRIVRGKYDKSSDVGDTSHFGALSTALSGTVGTGNIAGVALAIHLGGPAALFWMLVTAFFGMTTKFVEVTLSHKYREMDAKGHVAGGPMYYMKNALKLKWLAVIFAIATVFSSFGTGSLPQINSIANAMYSSFGLKHIVTGAILTVILGFIMIGGIKRIARVSEMLVPFMAVFYFAGSLLIIFSNLENLGPSIAAVAHDIFTGSAAVGGFLGASISFAINRGVNRGLFSNEAGQGSAPIAHAAAKAHEPVSEGMVAILEPFIDTIIICTLTGLTVLCSGAWKDKFQNDFQDTDMIVLDSKYDESNQSHKEKLSRSMVLNETLPVFSGDLLFENGEVTNELSIIHARSVAEGVRARQNGTPFNGIIKVSNGKLARDNNNSDVIISGQSLLHSAPLTTEAFKRGPLGDYGQYIVSIGLLLFAFSTAISWSYYGDRAITYLFGAKAVIYYHVVYVIAFFFASFTDTTIIWTLSGVTIALMTIPNLVGILLLHKDMKQTVKDYWFDFNKLFGHK